MPWLDHGIHAASLPCFAINGKMKILHTAWIAGSRPAMTQSDLGFSRPPHTSRSQNELAASGATDW